jgi:hypothetical protein
MALLLDGKAGMRLLAGDKAGEKVSPEADRSPFLQALDGALGRLEKWRATSRETSALSPKSASP